MAVRYGEVAAWAREAGYDGVQLGSSNAKMLHQLISPFYNRRTDEFGGSLEKRAGVLRLVREAVAERAGEDFTCTVKIPIEKAPPALPRIRLAEGLRMCELAQEWGFHGVTPIEVSVFPDTTLSRGGIPRSLWENQAIKKKFERSTRSRLRKAVLRVGYLAGARLRPFQPVWNRRYFTEAKRRLSIPVSAVGGIRTPEEVNEILDGGQADLVGIARPFYAEPDLPERILGGSDQPRWCRNSNFCVPAQMFGMKAACYNPEVRKAKVEAGTSVDD
jgi:2,4-dienoyl-CoA reductase-like NADH-dependent reductase (Old Yellow Enzyme family)